MRDNALDLGDEIAGMPNSNRRCFSCQKYCKFTGIDCVKVSNWRVSVIFPSTLITIIKSTAAFRVLNFADVITVISHSKVQFFQVIDIANSDELVASK